MRRRRLAAGIVVALGLVLTGALLSRREGSHESHLARLPEEEGQGEGEWDSKSVQPDKVAWATLVTDDKYLLGALVMADSIKFTQSIVRNMLCLVTDGVSRRGKEALEMAGYTVQTAPRIALKKAQGEARYATTYSKLAIWDMTQYEKLLYMDADVLLQGNMDEVFSVGLGEDQLAAGDDCCEKFNPGVVLLRPSHSLFQEMLGQIDILPTFDGGDGGFLNSFYNATRRKRVRLPFKYNADQIILSIPRYKPIYRDQDVRAIHYGGPKPWDTYSSMDDQAGKSGARGERGKEVQGMSPKLFTAVHSLWHRAYDRMARRRPELLKFPDIITYPGQERRERPGG